MPLSPFGQPLRDLSPGRWLQQRLWPWGPGSNRVGVPVGCLVPEGFPAYARIVHPAFRSTDHGQEPVRWSTVAEWTGRRTHPTMQFHPVAGLKWPTEPPWGHAPWPGTLQTTEAEALLPILRAETTTPGRCFFALWEGFGDAELNSLVASFPRLELTHRAYLLFRGSLETFPWFDTGLPQSPNLWWPDDHAWVVASEIDGFDTYLAGSKECVERVLNEPVLEGLPATVDARADGAADTING